MSPTKASTMARKVRSWALTHPALAIVLFLGALGIALLGFLGAAKATSEPVFCNSCHEMTPYYTAWRQGPHAEVPCVDCHVDSEMTKQLSHKVVALGEVWVHVTGEPTFPMRENAPIPDARCLQCHADINEPGYAGFSHKDHAAKGPCTDCHDNAGHTVSASDLEAAGILDAERFKVVAEERIATVGKGEANLEGHVDTTCQSCHDMQATGCASCHTPEHEKQAQTCTTCHSPGVKWVFQHPAKDTCAECHTKPETHTETAPDTACAECHAQRGKNWAFAHPANTDCESCHARPAEHRTGACATCHTQTGVSWAYTHPGIGSACADCHTRPSQHRAGSCQTCHKKAGVSWAFSHPGATATCTSCHARPAGHSGQTCTNCHSVGATWAFKHPASGNCAGCHARPAGHSGATCANCHKKAGTSWAFSHPGSGATCTGCHARPAGHSGQTCTNCHSVGATWAFRHPGATATCTSCHARPSGHSASACTSCHAVGTSWAFKHPTSTSCSSCHRAPSNHYGTSCSSCHTPTKAWSSATFSHPGVPGGEHSYRSFACANCHPSGYSSYSCTGCHGPGGPDDDD